jgi:hypothetical protein
MRLPFWIQARTSSPQALTTPSSRSAPFKKDVTIAIVLCFKIAVQPMMPVGLH